MYDNTDNTDDVDNTDNNVDYNETIPDKIARHILDHSEVYAVGAAALVVGVGVGTVFGTALGTALTNRRVLAQQGDAAASVLRLLVAYA